MERMNNWRSIDDTGDGPTTVYPSAVEVRGGRLQIISDEQTAPRIGVGTKVYLDGKELTEVKSIVLTIKAEDIVRAVIELNV